MAQGKKPDKKYAVTDIDQVDADFALQGEYVGEVITGQYDWQPIGLQVVALGGGKYHAVEFLGGLPGSGAPGPYRFKLDGQRHGNVARFVSGPLTVAVEKDRATLYLDSLSRPLGYLQKVQRVSSTQGAPAPSEATVLFDGTNTNHFKDAKMTEDGLLMMGTETNDAYRNFSLHLEFRLPYMPHARGQGRANSGTYLQSRYEVQILDSFGLEGVHNECGGLYKQRKPDINMCFPPLVWQTYDIEFQAAQFDEAGDKTANARLTVRHNGVVIHNNVELVTKTGAGKPETSTPLPTKLQDHNNPVVFRNIWIVDHDKASAVQ